MTHPLGFSHLFFNSQSLMKLWCQRHSFFLFLLLSAQPLGLVWVLEQDHWFIKCCLLGFVICCAKKQVLKFSWFCHLISLCSYNWLKKHFCCLIKYLNLSLFFLEKELVHIFSLPCPLFYMHLLSTLLWLVYLGSLVSVDVTIYVIVSQAVLYCCNKRESSGFDNLCSNSTAWLSKNLDCLILFWNHWLSVSLETLVNLRYGMSLIGIVLFFLFPLHLFFTSLMKTGRSISFRPAVSHLLCAGFTEIWTTVKHLIQARYEAIISNEENVGGVSKNGDTEENSQNGNSFLEKDLEAALDSFDNLFCRRCLVRLYHELH